MTPRERALRIIDGLHSFRHESPQIREAWLVLIIESAIILHAKEAEGKVESDRAPELGAEKR